MNQLNQEHPTLNEDKLIELATQVGEYSMAVREGRISIEEAAAILVKPPFNYANLRHARHVLDPGPPTP